MFATGPAGPELLHDDTLGPERFARYRAYYYARDLWLHGAAARGLFVTGAVIPDEAMVERAHYRRSEFYNDFMRPVGVDRMCGVVLERGGESQPSIAMSLYRPIGADAFEDEARAFLRGLVPHLRRAVRLQLRLQDLSAAPSWSLTLLEQLPWGVFLLDRCGKIVHLNRAAERIVSLNDGLSIAHRRLEPARREDRRRLEAVLARSLLTGLAAVDGDVALDRPSGARPFLLTVVPVNGRGAHVLASPAVRLAVHITNPAEVPADAGSRLAGLFDLTPAETRLALDLVAGGNLPEAAAKHRLSVETLKTQLKSLFAKTNTSRQAALALLLQRGLDLPRWR